MSEWHEHETYKSMIAYGQGMLRFVFLINGGAIVGVMTFLGHMYEKDGRILGMQPSIIMFLIGILLAGLASACAYLTQFCLFRETIDRVQRKGWTSHVTWVRLTMLMILLSLGCFATGSLTAISELS